MSPRVSIRESEAPRGGWITVDVSALDDTSDTRVELVLVERTDAGLTERAKRNELVVASVPVAPIGHSTTVPVPDDLPDPYFGPEATWFYEVAVADGRRSIGKTPRTRVHITGDADPADRHPDAGPALERTPPKVTAPPTSIRPAALWTIGTIVVCLATAVVALATGNIGAWLVTLFIGWLGLSIARQSYRSHQGAIGGLACEVAARHVARGVPFTVDVLGRAGHDVEVGLRGVEAAADHDHGWTTNIFHDAWVSVSGDSASFTIPTSQPTSYAGGSVSVTWSVAVRPALSTGRNSEAAEYRVTVHVSP